MKLVLAVLLALVLGLGVAFALLLVRQEASASAHPLGQGAEPAAPAQERLSTDFALELAALEARLEGVAEEVARLREELQRSPATEPAGLQAPADSAEAFLQQHRDAVQRVIDEDRDRLWLEERIRGEQKRARQFAYKMRSAGIQLSESDLNAALEILERWQRRNLELYKNCPWDAYEGARREACLETLKAIREGRRAEILAALGVSVGEQLLNDTSIWDPDSVNRDRH